jgi:hypothetical protein
VAAGWAQVGKQQEQEKRVAAVKDAALRSILSVVACLEASLAIHQTLPPIDAVAWDWIPAAPDPLLLEGNSGFGMLVPQLWDHLDERNAAGPQH